MVSNKQGFNTMHIKPTYYSSRHKVRVRKLRYRTWLARNLKVDSIYLFSLAFVVLAAIHGL